MSRRDKLIEKLLQRPKDFSFDELVTLLSFFSYEEVKKGKTGGSRRAFVQNETKHVIPAAQTSSKKHP